MVISYWACLNKILKDIINRSQSMLAKMQIMFRMGGLPMNGKLKKITKEKDEFL